MIQPQKPADMQQALENVRKKHKELLLQMERPEEADVDQVRTFLKTISEAGTTIEDVENRSLLLDLIRYWSSFINDKTGEYPVVQLQPFDISLRQNIVAQHPGFSSQDALERLKPRLNLQNRQRMLKRVRSTWIEGILENSLHNAALIELGMHQEPNAVENPWRFVMQESGRSTFPLPPGTRIIQVYDDADGELLILGEPGAGKTTLLLELARELLDRAQVDDTYPMPVVFNLTSWSVKRQPIVEWFIEELNTKYQVPRKLGQTWVEADQILPLLDGLDEVSLPYRAACVDAINEYRHKHLVPIVVCGRTAEYLNQEKRLLLHSAIVVQPLTAEQIDTYLSSRGEQLADIRLALQGDPTLQELVATPLMLSVLTLAYQGISISGLKIASLEMQPSHLLTTYVERMLTRRGSDLRFPHQQTIQWLSWLAQQMAQHNQTEFYLERMQVDWLSKGWSLWLYRFLALGTIDALIGLLLGWLIGGLVISHIGLLGWGLIGLLTGAVLSGRTSKKKPMEHIPWSWSSPVKIKELRSGLGTGLVIGLIVGFINDFLLLKDTRLIAVGADILEVGLIGALIGVLSSILIHGRSAEIQPAELVVWSWRNIIRIKYLRKGLDIGLVIGLVNFLIYWLLIGPLFALLYGLTSALLGVLFSTLLIGLFAGLSSEVLDVHSRVKPNEGMWRSARNSMIVGLVVGVLFGLVSGVLFGLVSGLGLGLFKGLVEAVILGLFYGLISGLLSGLLFGGDACIRYIILRLLLWRTKSIPWNYPRFLDYAAEHILLRKVGGGYIFIHHLLLDYFASLDASSLPHHGVRQVSQSLHHRN